MLKRTAIFLAMAGTTLALCFFFPNAATNPESGLVIWLPDQYDGLQGTKEQMSEQEVLWLPPDTTQMKMVYRNPLLQKDEANYKALSATLILAGADPRSLHRPEVCMPAQGWEIVKREVVPVETRGGTIEVMDLHLLRYWQKNDGSYILDPEGNRIKQRAHYVYWWVGRDDSTPHSWERVLRSSLNNVLKNVNDRWGYPSVMMMVDERLGDRGQEEARAQIYQFIRDVAPQYQKSLGAQEKK